MSDIASLVEGRRILVCCGSGGVGKTTTAAVLALEGARRGRRAVVVTIDPAKRLADALGMESLSNTAHQIEGDWSGELWALMLDTKSTFDALVAKYSASPEQAQRILDNPLIVVTGNPLRCGRSTAGVSSASKRSADQASGGPPRRSSTARSRSRRLLRSRR